MFAALNLKNSTYEIDVLQLVAPGVKSDLFVHPYRTRQMLHPYAGNLS